MKLALDPLTEVTVCGPHSYDGTHSILIYRVEHFRWGKSSRHLGCYLSPEKARARALQYMEWAELKLTEVAALGAEIRFETTDIYADYERVEVLSELAR